MRRIVTAAGLAVLAACYDPVVQTPDPPAMVDVEPDYVTIDLILIGARSPRVPDAKYDERGARKVAYDVLARARRGESWAALKKEHSDDPAGPHTLVNRDVRRSATSEAIARHTFGESVGDSAFRLAVDATDAVACAFGYYVIKRIK